MSEFSGAGLERHGGQMTPQEIYVGVKHGSLTAEFWQEIFSSTLQVS